MDSIFQKMMFMHVFRTASVADRFGISRFLGSRRSPLCPGFATHAPPPLCSPPQTSAPQEGIDFTTAKIAVWWDTENCHIPKGYDARRLGRSIRDSLEKANYQGPVSIYAFGDMQLIPHLTQQALISTGIDLHHVPPKNNDDKDVSDYKIIGDIFNWTMTNPNPANIMVISGDKDYSVALHQLRLRRYNILLGVPLNGASPSLVIAGNQVWLWTSLLAGGNPLTKTGIAQLIK